jgi:hypothetical protein
MHCLACGANLGESLRCSQCRRITPGLWLNLYSLSLIVLLVATNWIHLHYMVPIVVNLAESLGMQLSLAFRIYLGLSAAGTWGGLLIAAIVVLLLVLRKIPNFLHSGRLLAIGAWMFLLYTLAGIFAGYGGVLAIPSRLK